jgi:uncharacterized protein YjgD (DUF1641 family)
MEAVGLPNSRKPAPGRNSKAPNHQLNMAQPIPLEMPARDPRTELQARLQNAPLEHAEALLSAYEVLQGLHDRGALEVLRGALGSRDKVLEIIVEAANAPEAIRGIRNFIILAKILGTIEPELVEGLARSLPEAIALTKARESRPPAFWGLLKEFTNKNSRRGLFLFGSILEAFGRNLPPEESTSGRPH